MLFEDAFKSQGKAVRGLVSKLMGDQPLHFNSDAGHFVGYTGQSHKSLHKALLSKGFKHDEDTDEYRGKTKGGEHVVHLKPMGSNLTHVTVHHLGDDLNENLDNSRITSISTKSVYSPSTSSFRTIEKVAPISNVAAAPIKIKKKPLKPIKPEDELLKKAKNVYKEEKESKIKALAHHLREQKNIKEQTLTEWYSKYEDAVNRAIESTKKTKAPHQVWKEKKKGMYVTSSSPLPSDEYDAMPPIKYKELKKS